MARRIIEDIKFNKVEKRIPLVKKVIPSPKLTVLPDDYEEKKEVEKNTEKKKELKINEYFENLSLSKQRLQRTPQAKTKPKILHKLTLVIFILSIIIGGVYWGGNIFQKVDITMTVKHKSITYKNKQFIASKDLNGNSINFEIMITSDKESKNIILTQSKDVSIKAKGSITLYNEFSTTPEKLVSGTFLSDNDGKAYKINNAITIPGYKMDNKKIIPGQVVVNISSFLAGDAYNGSPSDFYINSFKGTTKYSKIYGKLKDPLIGGASGPMYTLDDMSKSKINNIAQSSFKEDLLRQVRALVPPGYILYPDALTFSYKIEDNFLSKTPEAEIPIEGSLSVVLLKEKNLMDNVIKISLPDISGNELKEITISDLNKFSFNFVDKNQLITKDMSSVSFLLSGDVDAIWNPDKNVLKTKLLGINKNEILSIFKQDPGIASALVKIFPPWRKYTPDDLSKINIIVN